MRQEYRVRDRAVRRIGGMLLAAGLLCAGWGAASAEASPDGIRRLCASPNGDVIGTVVWDEQREGAVFVWDAATGAVRTVFRASGARVSLSLMPGSTPAFASWDAAAGRIVLEGGQPLSLRVSEDAAGDAAWAITGQGVRITPESLIYLVQYADGPCSVFRASLADYGEANLLTDAAAGRAECAAVSETGDAVVTWDGFAFDLYAPDGTTGALAKVGAWTLAIDAGGALHAEPRS